MNYNRTDAKSIELYAKKLIGKTFLDILYARNFDELTQNNAIVKYGNPNRKGGLGNFLEEIYFKYKANSDSRPDFHEVGIELKVSPYEIRKKGNYKAGERLVITMIDYRKPVESIFKDSHLWLKIQKILLVYYFRNREIKINLQYRIDFTGLFSPSQEDLIIIKNDYKLIITKIQNGLAHELSESDTMYLAACTKGATAENSKASQYYNLTELAKTRAFSFKISYMTQVLHILMGRVKSTESIITDANSLEHTTFENFILTRLSSFYGKTDKMICDEFGREYNNNKAQWIDLAYRMLGIKSNKASEFIKANITVKAIRLEENGQMKENISFPTFRFNQLINEKWEKSTIRNYLEATKFLFVIYKKQGDKYILSHAKFWNMSISDLDTDAKLCWEETVSKVKNGVIFRIRGKRILNNLPLPNDNRVMHVRPHANRSAYSLKDGTNIGDINSDGDELPDGQWMTRQSFWLNKTYILTQI